MTRKQTRTFEVVFDHLTQHAQNPRELSPIGATRVLEADRRDIPGTVVVFVRPDGAWTHSRNRAEVNLDAAS